MPNQSKMTSKQKSKVNCYHSKQRINSYNQAKKLIQNRKFHLATIVLEELYRTYPDDDNLARELAMALKYQAKYDEAINILEAQEVITPLYFKELTRLYIRTENYDKAYHLLSGLTEEDISQIKIIGLNEFYRLTKIYLHNRYSDIPLPLELSGYLENAVLSYDENFALRHIKIRHSKSSLLSPKDKGSIFEDTTSIEDLFYQLKSNLELSKREIKECDFFDSYLYAYDDNKIRKIRVLTIPNTTNIITMYPVDIQNSEKINILVKK